MGNDIQAGVTFVDGQLYHGSDFNNAINNSTILSTSISSRSLKSTMSGGDEILINDNGTLRKITGQQIIGIATLPAGVMMDYAGTTEPLGWIFCYGQLLSRTTYAALFAAIGGIYGVGDGSTTFAVPDCRGRVTAGDDNMGGTAANRLTSGGSGIAGITLGAAGGAETHVITDAQMSYHQHSTPDHLHYAYGVDHLHAMANHQHSITVYPSYQTVRSDVLMQRMVFWDTQTGGATGGMTAGANTGAADRGLGGWTSGSDRGLQTDFRGGNTAHNNTQPTIITNKIIKT